MLINFWKWLKMLANAPQMYQALTWLYTDAEDRGEVQNEDGEYYADWGFAKNVLDKIND